MKTNRRDFLKAAAGTVAAAGAITITPSIAIASEDENAPFAKDTMVKFYDSTVCVGCQACVVACYKTNFMEREKNLAKPLEELNFIERNDIIPVIADEDKVNSDKPWIVVNGLDYRLRTIIKKHVDDEGKSHFIKQNCMHCKKPGCVSACPVHALEKDKDDGVVTYDPNRCIGCRYCQMACPFNIPAFDWHRANAKITKCDMCRSTINPKSNDFDIDADGNATYKDNPNKGTACTKVCPTGAVLYGRREDLLKLAHDRIKQSKEKGENKYYEDTARGESVLGEKVYGGTGELVISAVDFRKLDFPVDKIGDRATAYKSENIQHTIYKYGIAPIALFGTLAFFVNRNNKNHHEEEHKKQNQDHKNKEA